MNINTSSIRVFQDYMLFFEHAKWLKAASVVSRGLVSPEIDNSQNILKRISSILLKGLRSDKCLDVGSILSNNFQKIKLGSITRQRQRRVGTSTNDYFTFLNKYEFTKFIEEDHYDGSNVKVVSSSEHKRRFAQTLFGEDETDDINELLRTHEFVFAPTPLLWNIGNEYARYANEAIAHINESLTGSYPGQGYRVENVAANCVLDNSVNGISWYHYRNYGEETIKGLYKKYYRGEDVRVPSIGAPENFSPVISDTTIRRILDANSNHLLCMLSSHFRSIPEGIGLYLCKRFEDENGECLAPNLIDGNIEYYWKCSAALLDDPAAFYKAAEDINSRIKNKLVGITNE